MKKFLTWSLIPLLAALVGCAGMHHEDPFMQIQPGMEAYQVRQILGDPIDRKFTGTHQEWLYRRDMGKKQTKEKVIVIDNDHVVALADDEVSAERQFEIAKARAAAPKIEQPYVGGRGNLVRGTSSGFVGGGLLCTGHNEYGEFAKDGGCNKYGCWAPGGSCNEFGCSATDECKKDECKNRTPSYQCVKK